MICCYCAILQLACLACVILFVRNCQLSSRTWVFFKRLSDLANVVIVTALERISLKGGSNLVTLGNILNYSNTQSVIARNALSDEIIKSSIFCFVFKKNLTVVLRFSLQHLKTYSREPAKDGCERDIDEKYIGLFIWSLLAYTGNTFYY